MDLYHIHKMCRILGIFNYYIRPDGTVDVFETVDLKFKDLYNIPIQFGEVHGNFWCNDNNLTSLIGCPRKITGSFICANNKLTSLVGGPEEVYSSYIASFNNLISLDGLAHTIGDFPNASYIATQYKYSYCYVGDLELSHNHNLYDIKSLLDCYIDNNIIVNDTPMSIFNSVLLKEKNILEDFIELDIIRESKQEYIRPKLIHSLYVEYLKNYNSDRFISNDIQEISFYYDLI